MMSSSTIQFISYLKTAAMFGGTIGGITGFVAGGVTARTFIHESGLPVLVAAPMILPTLLISGTAWGSLIGATSIVVFPVTVPLLALYTSNVEITMSKK
jgi:hypothetical protein